MLANLMSQFKTTDWEDLLTQIMYNLNTQIHSATHFTPYEIVFSKKPINGQIKKFVELNEEKENENHMRDYWSSTIRQLAIKLV
ncbi:unnamed protein product [Brachionus calyciflorus]|uniref:Integrase catalytic domain-containing protein n=1 Tax=Brachionus calyciflorus TaxID=104777 RepID=A0A813WXT9_9BILA|nr:unnamed protein product [Brachionus calyciflorus]